MVPWTRNRPARRSSQRGHAGMCASAQADESQAIWCLGENTDLTRPQCCCISFVHPAHTQGPFFFVPIMSDRDDGSDCESRPGKVRRGFSGSSEGGASAAGAGAGAGPGAGGGSSADSSAPVSGGGAGAPAGSAEGGGSSAGAGDDDPEIADLMASLETLLMDPRVSKTAPTDA